MTRKPTTVERYEAKVDRSGGPDTCHLWTACLSGGRYGHFSVDGRMRRAHRWGYEYYVGPIPDGLQIRHICDRPACQNLAHMLTGTNQDNVNDRDERERQSRGEEHWNATLTEADVHRIRELRAEGWLQREIGEKFGVDQSLVSLILLGKQWSHV